VIGKAFYVSYKDKLEALTIISEWDKHGKPVDVFKLEKSDMIFYTKVSGTINGFKIRANVTSGIRSKLQDGQIFFIENDGEKIKGLLDNVSDYRDKQSGLYLVELRITDKVKLPQGSIVTANIQSRKMPGLLCVPSESIERSNNKTYVWLINKEKKAEKKEVELGLTNGEKHQVISGLNSGDIVVTSGKDFLSEGDEVMIHKTFKCIDEL
jgi:RND family efflux transporter MFP subunit